MGYSDIVLFVIFIIVFGIGIVSMKYAFDVTTGEMNTVFGDPTVSSWFSSINSIWIVLDYAVLIAYVCFLTGSVVLSFFVRSHPVFYIFFMLATLGLTFVSYLWVNVFEEFINSVPEFSSIYNQFTWLNFFIDNLPLIVLITSVVIGIFTYSKQNILERFGYYG